MASPRPSILVAVLLLLVAAAYTSVLPGGFVWDDHALIEGQPLVTEGAPASAYFTRMFWGDKLDPTHRGFYRPLVTLSYAADYRLGGGSPFPFHLENVLWHLAVCLLVFFVARRFGAEPLASAYAAAAFGLFPRLTESVAWISGRTDVLAMVGALGAIALWEDEGQSRWRTAAAVLAFTGGELCKETAVVGPLVLAARAWLSSGPTFRARVRALARLWPFAIGGALYLALRLDAQLSDVDLSAAHQVVLPPLLKLLTPLQAIGSYVWMALDPFQPRTQIGLLGRVSWPLVALGAAAGVAGCVLLVRMARRAPPAESALVLGGVAALLPVIHVLPLDVKVVAADRYLYPALACFFCAFAVWTSRQTGATKKRLLALALAMPVLFFVPTYLRADVWGNEARLWQTTIEEAPDSGQAYAGLATVRVRQRRYHSALGLFEKAVELDESLYQPIYGAKRVVPTTLGGVAECEEALGQFDQAEHHYQDLVAAYPGKTVYLFDRAMASARAGKLDEARRQLESLRAAGAGQDVSDALLADLAKAERAIAATAALGDSAEAEAQRAAAYDLIGARYLAVTEWMKVVGDPHASADALRRAAGYLALNGDRAEAAASVDRLRGLSGEAELVGELEGAIASRWAE